MVNVREWVDAMFQQFTAKCPFAVMTQIAIRGLVGPELKAIFENCRSRQYEKVVGFTDVAMAVADVALNFAENFNQTYKTHRHKLRVSLASFYNKLNATETAISEGLVRMSAQRAELVQHALGFQPRVILSGYRVLCVDGNHGQETEKRLKVLRDQIDAPLPFIAVAVFDPQRALFQKIYALEDAHAQECSVISRLVADLQPRDVLLGDRHFCVLELLREIDRVGANFVIRQHGRFKGVLVGERKQIVTTARGIIYEQEIRTTNKPDAHVMRRITIALNKPTKANEMEVHFLSNLPAEIGAETIAELYLVRWEEEVGFYHLTTTLTCEVPSISQPRAALFLFSMATLAYNVRQVLYAAQAAEHPAEKVAEVSQFQISVEISRYTDGLLVAIPEPEWQRLVPRDPAALATLLREVARTIDLSQYRIAKRGPKKPKVKPHVNRRKTHVSTYQLMAKAKQAKAEQRATLKRETTKLE